MITLIKYGAVGGGEKYNANIMYIDGLSGDTKPTGTFEGTPIPNASVYTEIDTGKEYTYDSVGAQWYETTTSGGGGGGGGTTNYAALSNKPQINGTTLSGNKTSADLGLQGALTQTQLGAVNSGVTANSVNVLEDILDSGEKNIIFNGCQSYTSGSFTCTVNANGSITLNGTVPSSMSFLFTNLFTGAKTIDGAYDNVRHFPQGNYRIAKSSREADVYLQIIAYNTSSSVAALSLTDVGDGSKSFTVDNTYAYNFARIRIITGKSFSNFTFMPFVCTEDAWLVSKTVTPYRMTTDEITSALNGKQNTIDSSHKLSADNVDDTNTTNKFATAAELTQIETNKNNILNAQTASNGVSYNTLSARLNAIDPSVNGYYFDVTKDTWTVGGIGSDGNRYNSSQRVSNYKFYFLQAGMIVLLVPKTGMSLNYHLYTYTSSFTYTHDYDSGWIPAGRVIQVDHDCVIRFCSKLNSGANMEVDDITGNVVKISVNPNIVKYGSCFSLYPSYTTYYTDSTTNKEMVKVTLSSDISVVWNADKYSLNGKTATVERQGRSIFWLAYDISTSNVILIPNTTFAENVLRGCLIIFGWTYYKNSKPVIFGDERYYLENDIDYAGENVISINHRGYTSAPENTIPAFKLSKERGFRYVETDVTYTSDGVAVLLHDNTINRTARNADGTELSETVNISDITYTQALDYDFGIYKNAIYAGTKIPTFEQFIALCKNLNLKAYIELKTSGEFTQAKVNALIGTVKRYGMIDNVTWISFSKDYLGYVHTAHAAARLGYAIDTITQTAITDILALKGTNDVFLDCNRTNITSELIELCIAADVPVEAWTFDTEAQIKNMDTYITGITTNQYKAIHALYAKANE